MRISVIVPAYNEEAVIGRCLEALVTQTVPADEIIVVDNNSSDRTVEVAEQFSEHGVRVVRESKQGAVHARNRGFDEADGDILGRIDADTMVGPEWVGRLAEAFTTDPKGTPAAVTGPSWFYDIPMRRFGLFAHRLFCHQINRMISGHPMLWGSNMALSRECWAKVRDHACTEPGLWEDLDLAVHLNRLGLRVRYVDTLRVPVSARRIGATARDLYSYLKAWPHTYRRHGQRGAAGGAMVFLLFGLVALRPFSLLVRAHTPYDGTLSLGRLFSRSSSASRPLP
ncbi:glycosyltransferase [Streptomonospora nanhaiensis]|uniref:glycosyltransferase n=1 Tax=Streptomonospora nanhaiensis TaxID=1323731 RepID=UPI001C998CC2|nr:glycosyltransferase family A protein [Streptomonospora nanhaiensis]MBX9390021.1 glycosyltransferase [Streptomonospora nanhaiensis]